MAGRLSSPLETIRDRYDVVVVGSGYGGGIAASRLARTGHSVCLLERGEERQPGEYPNTSARIIQQVQVDTPSVRLGSPTALFDLRYNKDINVIIGCGLGGTSLINAGLCVRPEPRIFAASAWPAELRVEGVLDPYFGRAEAMLRPSITPRNYLEAAKVAALGRASKQLHQQVVPIPVLVNFQRLENDTNHVGVTQYPCVGCGDCVSGCNFHAKNTLIMNYLPDARSHSAAIFTRARVGYVEHTNAGWYVHGQSVDKHGDGPAFTIGAGIVILAAGTLGSTEILLRSRDHGLPLSNEIGNHFSTNGDTIGFAYNTDNVINGIGLGVHQPGASPPIGPCSTVVLNWRDDSGAASGFALEDGAIPGALADVFGPLLAIDAKLLGTDTTRSLWARLKQRYRQIESSLFGAYRGAAHNTLFMLGITHDDSMGRMSLVDDRLRIDWPGLGEQPQFAAASEIMLKATRALGGTYVPNPLWNEFTHHNLATGHPLGGCVMADSADTGVVNHKGQVFAGEDGNGAAHVGLYVMDGSVVPTSLGVNPLLTISALAERSCSQLAQDYGWAIEYESNWTSPSGLPRPG